MRRNSAVAYDEDNQEAAGACYIGQHSVRQIFGFHFRAANGTSVFEDDEVGNLSGQRSNWLASVEKGKHEEEIHTGDDDTCFWERPSYSGKHGDNLMAKQLE
jgi:hypothetical protein